MSRDRRKRWRDGRRSYRATFPPMGSRSTRRICVVALSLFLFYILLISLTGNTFKYLSSRELKNIPLDNMVWRFIYGVRDCLRRETDHFEYAKNPFQETVADGSCNIVNVSVDKFKQIESKLRKENPICAVTNFEKHSKQLERSSSARVNALYVQLPHQQIRQLLKELSSDDRPICQVNLLYPEPSARREQEFVSDFNKLLTEGKYLLLRAEKDFSSTFMNLFLVNFSDDFCRNRYFRMYTFD